MNDTKRRQLSERIAQDINDFVSSGGRIKHLASDSFSTSRVKLKDRFWKGEKGLELN